MLCTDFAKRYLPVLHFSNGKSSSSNPKLWPTQRGVLVTDFLELQGRSRETEEEERQQAAEDSLESYADRMHAAWNAISQQGEPPLMDSFVPEFDVFDVMESSFPDLPPFSPLSRLALLSSHLQLPTAYPQTTAQAENTIAIDCDFPGCLDLIHRLEVNGPPDARERSCVHVGCGSVSRSREEWERHVVREHHARRRRFWEGEDWGEGGMCCA